jgi:hypothetical protein
LASRCVWDAEIVGSSPTYSMEDEVKIRTKSVITVQDWDELVRKTYGRPYRFQQQDGCKPRGVQHFTVPDDPEDYENDSIPEKVNGEEMGVSFKAWLARDPKQKIQGEGSFGLELWWDRNFYPHFQMIANDLHKRGLLKAGEYLIEIDW